MTRLRAERRLRGEVDVRHGKVLSPWLSDDMARALAAMCPPLLTRHVVRAADKLTAGVMVTFVIDDLLRSGADLLSSRRVVEALRALQDVLAIDLPA